jgi:ABC-2 type transport system permease protein
MRAALIVEWLKMRRSRVPRVAAIALLVLPAVMAALFLGMSGRGGNDAMTLKAEALVTRGGWAGFLDVLLQIYASAGLLGMGVVVAWSFGREYADCTVGSLYGSATPREVVAAAKLVVLTVWCLGLSVVLAPAAVLVGLAGGLGPPEAEAVAGVTRAVGLSALTGLLSLTVAAFASMGRGYLPAFGGLVGLVAAAQVAAVAGAGQWFPYSVPGLWAAASASPALEAVPTWHLVVVPCTAFAIGLGTLAWWRHAELV